MSHIPTTSFLSLLLILFASACKTNEPLITSQVVEVRDIDTVYISAENSVDITEPTSPYRPSYARSFDLLHTSLDVSFLWDEEAVIGRAALYLTPIGYKRDKLTLDAKNFTIQSIHIRHSNQDTIPFEYGYDGQLISVYFDHPVMRNDTIVIDMDYIARPRQDANMNAGIAISSDKGLFFIDPVDADPFKPTQIWTQGETEHNSKWFPTIDKPNERCTQRIRITLPDSLVSLSNGLLVLSEDLESGERADTWVLDKPHAPYLFMLAIGQYHVDKNKYDGLPVDYYVEPAYAEDADEIFNHTEEMISFFSDLLDFPYPWPKYAQIVVRDYVSGAMENTTASVFGQSVQKPSGDLIDNGNDHIVAHELFHQWFGNLVTCESWANLTLNEGFANYSEYLWQEYKYGKDAADYHRMTELGTYLEEAFTNVHPLIDFYYDDKEDMFDAHSYNKGGLVLHMLRDYLGDLVFFDGIRHYLKKMAWSSAEIHDLRLSFETVSGQDMNWFFNQWYFQPGHPKLKTGWEYNEKTQQLAVSIQQFQDGEHIPDVFVFPIELSIVLNSGEKRQEVMWIDKRTVTLEYAVSEKPLMLLFDPGKILLAEFTTDQVPDATVLYSSSQSVEDRIIALNAENASSNLYELALKDTFWRIRQLALRNLNTQGIDLKEVFLSVAVTDKHAMVRAEALNQIRQGNINVGWDVVDKIYLTDKSNAVKKEAFLILCQLDSVRIKPYLDSLRESRSPLLAEALGIYYLLNNISGKDSFFERSAYWGGYESHFNHFPLWGAYIAKQDYETILFRLNAWEKILNKPDINSYYALAILMGIDALVNESQTAKLTYSQKDSVMRKGINIFQSSLHILSKFGY